MESFLTFIIGLVILGQFAVILVLVRWIMVNNSNFRRPAEVKPEKPKSHFGGAPFGVRNEVGGRQRNQ